MDMEITIVKTFCDFGHNFFKKQPFWPFFIRILAISYEKNLATLLGVIKTSALQPVCTVHPRVNPIMRGVHH